MELTAEMIADIRAKAESYVESEKEDFNAIVKTIEEDFYHTA